MQDKKIRVIALLAVFSLTLVISPACALNPEMLSEDEYVNAYFSIYGDYIAGNGNISREEIGDIVEYYLTSKDLAGNLYVTGQKSGRMIGSILADSGVVFDCGVCGSGVLNSKCCIYRAGQEPMMYECVGTEVRGVNNYTWKEIYQCTFGCCANRCCRDNTNATTTTSPGTTTTLSIPVTTTQPAVTTTSSTTTTIPASTTTSTTSTISEPKLVVLFVPVDWTGGMDDFGSKATEHANFLVEHIPLKDCPTQMKAINVKVSCDIGLPMNSAECINNALQILQAIGACARASGEEYDYVVGLTDKDVCGATAGFSVYGTGVVFSESDAQITPHELGHEWNLVEEYVDACRCLGFTRADNCLDQYIGGSDPMLPYTSDYCAGGSACAGRAVTCQGNLNPSNGRCIMSYADAKEPREFCKHCWAHLLKIDFLTC